MADPYAFTPSLLADFYTGQATGIGLFGLIEEPHRIPMLGVQRGRVVRVIPFR